MLSAPPPDREATGRDDESVWDYPRPPRLEPVTARLVVRLGGEVVADTTSGYRVLETSHPPNYYFPADDITPDVLAGSDGTSYCEWKGRATYLCVRTANRMEIDAAWTYRTPSPAFAAIRDHVAFYAHRMDECRVDDEVVVPQPGGFYGGWITQRIKGPFKGGPGSRGW